MSVSRVVTATAVSVGETGSGNAWSSIDSALDDDGIFASVGIPVGSGDGARSKMLVWGDFDLDSFAVENPRIVGVKLVIDGYTTNAGGGVTDETLQLAISGVPVGSNHPSGLLIWPTSGGTYITVGGDGDLFGLDELSKDDLPNLQVQLILVNNNFDSSSETGYASNCDMTIYYQSEGVTYMLMGVGN